MTGIILTKGSPAVDLRKSDSDVDDGEVRIFTGWKLVPEAYDLDTGFLWESFDGQKGCVQALGSFGSFYEPPFLQLQGDDRRGGLGETILGNYAQILRHIKRVSLFLYVHNRNEPLSEIQGAYTEVTVPGFRPVRVTHEGQGTRACAILQMVNTGNGLRIEREMYSVPMIPGKYIQQVIDEHWGYGLQWSAASK